MLPIESKYDAYSHLGITNPITGQSVSYTLGDLRLKKVGTSRYTLNVYFRSLRLATKSFQRLTLLSDV